MILTYLLLFVGFLLLIKGADFLVKGSSSVARRFNISELAIGLTIVAFGTSAPELVVSIVSSVEGINNVVYGNVIGSNIFNLLFILGITGLIYPIKVQKQTIWKEIPYSLLAALILYFLLNDQLLFNDNNYFSRIDSFILLIFFFAFLIYIFFNLKNEEVIKEKVHSYTLPVSLLMIVGGFVGLIFGGRMVVNNALEIARFYNLSENLIGLTIIAAGTSLPELATSAVAAYRKNSDIAIGNIVGSNIFNILFILSVSGLINPMEYPDFLNFDLYVLMFGTFLVFFNMFSGRFRIIDRWEAGLLLIGYFGYMYYLFIRG